MPIADSHCHFFSPRFFEALAAQMPKAPVEQAATALPRQLGWEPPGSPAQLADRWAAELDRTGVARAVLIVSVPDDEESVAIAVGRHPARFVGGFMLDPTKDGAEGRAERALSDLNLRMLCLYPAMHHFRLDSSRALSVFDVAAATPGSAVFVHCGILTLGVRKKLGLASRFDMRLGNPLDLQAAASRHPDLPLILPHFGGGFFREALMAADLHPNIHLDTSSSNAWVKYHPGLTLTEVFLRSLAVLGPERLLFGTDSSFFPRGWQRAIWEEQASALDRAGVDAVAKSRIFHGNFDRLFAAG